VALRAHRRLGTYLRIPVRDASEAAAFYAAVFGWKVGGDPAEPRFADGTGHVLGVWQHGGRN